MPNLREQLWAMAKEGRSAKEIMTQCQVSRPRLQRELALLMPKYGEVVNVPGLEGEIPETAKFTPRGVHIPKILLENLGFAVGDEFRFSGSSNEGIMVTPIAQEQEASPDAVSTQTQPEAQAELTSPAQPGQAVHGQPNIDTISSTTTHQPEPGARLPMDGNVQPQPAANNAATPQSPPPQHQQQPST